MPARGGPMVPSAPETPGMVWQDSQPYLRTRTLPRTGSPPVIAAACRSTLPPQPQSARRASAKPAATAPWLSRLTLCPPSFERSQQHLATGVSHPPLGLAQPGRKQGQPQHDEEDPGRHPHDEPGELLVLQRREPPGRRPRLVDGIPEPRRESEESAEDAAVQ